MIKTVILKLTPLQAKGLERLASEGAAGLLTDERAAASYIGGPKAQAAAREALAKLKTAVFGGTA